MEQGTYATDATSFTSVLGTGSFHLPTGFAVMTQTCDVVRRPDRITIVKLVKLEQEDQLKWGGGKSPRYFQVSDDLFADFEQIAVVAYDAVAMVETYGMSQTEARAFRQAAGRRFGRAAVPTHLDEVLKPLQNWFKSRSSKALYIDMIERIREIRVSISPDWEEQTNKETVELTLLFEPGGLASPDDGSVSVGPAAEIAAAYKLAPTRALVKLAELLGNCIPGTPDDAATWDAIGECLARMMEEEAARVDPMRPQINNIIVTTRTKADMTVAEYEETERLDLSHLSSNQGE